MMELNEILKKHKMWLEGNKDGKRADLRDANLRYADLRGADLRYADLRYVDLRDANLRGADLRDANLRYADLRYVDLRDADLRGADLDFSCLPLWCGGIDFKIDNRIARQLLYHVINLTQEHIEFTQEQIDIANEFHRVGEVRKILKKQKNSKRMWTCHI